MPAYMYMVGDLGLAAQQAAGASKRATKAAAAGAENAVAATALDDAQPAQRRRRAKATMIGRGHEYMDLEPESTVTPSDRDTGPFGFAGSAAQEGGAEPSGLATLTHDRFGGDSTVPMLPTTWNPDLD
jgi:PPE-repeat protein